MNDFRESRKSCCRWSKVVPLSHSVGVPFQGFFCFSLDCYGVDQGPFYTESPFDQVVMYGQQDFVSGAAAEILGEFNLNNDGTKSVISMENNGTLFLEESFASAQRSFLITFLEGSLNLFLSGAPPLITQCIPSIVLYSGCDCQCVNIYLQI